MKNTIYIIDFGSQYSQLIAREIRNLGIYSELVTPTIKFEKLKTANGIILSGGPSSVYAKNAPTISKKIFDLDIPVLGICYGLQLATHLLGGKIQKSDKREYGPAKVNILNKQNIFSDLKNNLDVWMSHGDKVIKPAPGFEKIASTDNCEFAAIENKARKIYGLQFHPEVKHTFDDNKILTNFALKICKIKPDWKMQNFIDKQVSLIKNQVCDEKIITGVSGGVDSTVASALIQKAIGKNFQAIFIDHGLLRHNEARQVMNDFRNINLNVKLVNAQKIFLQKLKGVTSPEKKRKIIGNTFIKIFEQEAKKLGKDFKWLMQGTLYPDVIESAQAQSGILASKIKSHHNVGGLPAKMNLKLVEPLKMLFKDEVREAGKLLNLPETMVQRQPFPGPGLALRIIGTITSAKLQLVRKTDIIFREEIEKANLNKKIWQYFTVLPDIKSVGVQGDERSYDYPIILRAVYSSDGMTAHWAKIPNTILEKISLRITNEVKGINRVVYDITSKPPGTIEWE